jgi:aminopeptidase N
MASKDRDVLPDTVKPIHYTLELFDLELGGAFTYQGTVRIQVNINKAVEEITLNTHQLNVSSAGIIDGKSASKISYDEKSQRTTFAFSEAVQPSPNAVIRLEFSGTMNNSMAGFYRSKYKPTVTPARSVPMDGESHCMFSTQFESSDARRAFPCFDEPNLKATFDVSIEIPEDNIALSNMPEKDVKPSKNGRNVVTFERTPVMSTYLLAWAFGDFEYVEDFTRRKYNGKNLPVRVYTTRGLKEQGRFALENCHQVVDYFSDIFKIDYPLPKIDLLAVHEFSHGAMENWGLITYRTTAVLFDEEQSDAKYKNRVAYVVAHGTALSV